MIRHVHPLSRCAVVCLLIAISVSPCAAIEWTVPVGGNAFPNGEGGRRSVIGRQGFASLRGPEDTCSVFFHFDRAATCELVAVARSESGASTIRVDVEGKAFQAKIPQGDFSPVRIGRVEVTNAGYVRVDLRGGPDDDKHQVDVKELVVSSDESDLALTCVASNEGNMFYWGRRGPSVHLRYKTPPATDLRYAYSEITVPEGQDPIGSYFMANGFREGYFGIQVNSPSERRVLFSVWSPFRTDNPRDIPLDQRIECLASGPDVRIGEFGNEGSGGQSFLVYPWKAGVTYRFLTEVVPDGSGKTVYRCWFGDKSKNEWRLIAAFRRPKTDTHLKGFHAFLENFSTRTGHVTRKARYGNVWVRDTGGQWYRCDQATFSVDATGRGGHRLDFVGGVERDQFFLKNCGFFSGDVAAGEAFNLSTGRGTSPKIDFENLPEAG